MLSTLQLPPPLELAIGQLSTAEQSLIQVSMRVLASHLDAPCRVVTKQTGDITLKPGDDHNILQAVSAHGEVFIDRPVRLLPLSEALSKLIAGIVSYAQPQLESNADDAPVTQPALFDLLLSRSVAGPIEVQLDSGRTLLLDSRYSVAHLSSPADTMLPALASDHVARIRQISPKDFAQRTAKGSTLHPLATEQLCWALPATSSSAPALDRWHRDTNARLNLVTWPNLSAQHDAQAWLSVLARLFQRGMKMSALREALIAAGIPTARVLHGISLLLAYRHAHIVAAGDTNEMVVVPISIARRAPTKPNGLLARLRSQLNALAA